MASSSPLTEVHAPSIGALAYQAQVLLDSLSEIQAHEHPDEACVIRDVIAGMAQLYADELEAITLAIESSTSREDQELESDRGMGLGMGVHELFSLIRYLRTSAPNQTPPAMQLAVSYLMRRYFPQENGRPICLVRPQWSYNLEFVALNDVLENLLPTNLDPNKSIGPRTFTELIESLWRSKRITGQETDKQD